MEHKDVYVPDLYGTAALARDVALSDSPATQVIGRAGQGKSTFLAAVAEALLEADTSFQSIYLQPLLWNRVPVPDKDIRVLILDEAERLSRWNLAKLLCWANRGGRLIVSSHRELCNSQTIELPVITAGGLQQFFLSRLSWAGSVDHRFELTTDGADWILNISEGNLRVVEAVLYELFQAAADEVVRQPDSAPTSQVPLKIDSAKLSWLEVFAARRASLEAQGNVPFTRWRLLSQSIRGTTRRISGWFSGQTSTRGPTGRELPRQR